jgi:hypothetical protein
MLKLLIALFFVVAITNSLEAQTDTLGDLAPTNFRSDFTSYNQRTAVYCARMSDLIYADTNRLRVFQARYNAKYPDQHIACRFFNLRYSVFNLQMMIWAAPSHMVVTFRGTDSFNNWLVNIRCLNYDWVSDSLRAKYHDLPAGHGGFRRSIVEMMNELDLMSEIRRFVMSKYGDLKVPVYMTGHSLGAALCTMLALPLRKNGFDIKGMYFFAPPLAISCEEGSLHDQLYGRVTHNIVNYKDYIPRAGLRGTLRHFGKFYRICDNGQLNLEPERYVPMNGRERARILQYHSMENHLSLVRDNINSDILVNERHTNKIDCMSCEVIINPCNSRDRRYPCPSP